MIKKKYKEKGYWTKEKCHEESLKYNTKKEFKNNNSGAYKFAYRNGFLNDICSHMLKNNNKNNDI